MESKLKKNAKTVFVGVSGGVDSSVSAALLKDQGFRVIGVFIRTWTPDFINCTWRDERRDAMRVCAHLDIPFLECDAEEVYKKNVADYMIEEYSKGNTPNPDVMCNREVKFGVFWDFARAHGADYIATGHYARIIDGTLARSKDEAKDQSYFLWTLTQGDLPHTLFPVGHLQKSEVRKLAIKYKLPTATKKDSQGVCFLGPLDMKNFLKRYIKTKSGDVLSLSGEVIGRHDGAVFFTLGERHGFTIFKNSKNSQPLYILSKDIKKNTITVSARQDLAETKPMRQGLVDDSVLKINKANWISGLPKTNKKYTAQIRYHGEQIPCTIKIIGESKAEVIFAKSILVSSGQSVVIYDRDLCLGGGIMV